MIDDLAKLLDDYKNAKIGFQEAIEALKKIPFENLGFARIDHHREMRKGIPEAIFGMGKTPEQILEIVRSYVIRKTVMFWSHEQIRLFMKL